MLCLNLDDVVVDVTDVCFYLKFEYHFIVQEAKIMIIILAMVMAIAIVIVTFLLILILMLIVKF